MITDDNERHQAATRNRTSADLERHKAALYVCHRADGAEDARELLLALGLVDQGFKWVGDRFHGTRKKVTE